MAQYLKQCKEASEELEKTGNREKLKKGDEGEEKDGWGEEGESWGECVETDCFHLGKIGIKAPHEFIINHISIKV